MEGRPILRQKASAVAQGAMADQPSPGYGLASKPEGTAGEVEGVEYVSIAPATDAHPRNDSATIIAYFTSRMANPEPPGKLGRAAMSLKGAIVGLDWFYR